MKLAVRLATPLMICWLAAGCETTGDPRQGGLFGWSEAKARGRQNERQMRVAGAETELKSEEAHRDELQSRNASANRDLSGAQLAHDRAEARLRAQQAALIAKTGQLERESSAPAMASRARSYRLKVNTVAAQTALPAAQRSARLKGLEIEIDAALAQAER